MIRHKSLLLSAVSVFVVVLALFAQQTNVGNITGSVADSTGAIVPDAEVVAMNSATNVTYPTVTTSAGLYNINLLPVGKYSVTVSKAGFEKGTRTDVEVIAGQTFTVNFVLQVGSVTQTVTVSGAPPLLNTTDTTQGTSRSLQELQDLPINLQGNAALAAISTIQTLSGINFNTEASGGQSWTIISRSIINGIQGGFGYDIDGVEAAPGEAEDSDYVTPVPDAIQEVRLTDNTDTTIGFNAGSSIAMVTKSGTNDFHGDAYYYVRNDAMEARNWFLARVPEDKQNEGGITMGGPVYIPHVYDGRNKTFFFGTMDIYRYVTTTAGGSGTVRVLATVPTQDMRDGNFTSLLGPQVGTDALGRPVYQGEIYDPSTTRQLPDGSYIRDPFDYNGVLNTVNPADASKVSTFFLNNIALPNLPGIANNWVGPSSKSLTGKDQWSLKIDQAIGQKHRLTFSAERQFAGWLPPLAQGAGHYRVTGSDGWLNDITSDGSIDERREYRYRLNYVWTPKPDLMVNFNAGVTRDPNRIQTPVPTTGPVTTADVAAGLTGTLNPRAPDIGIENSTSTGPPWDLLVEPAQRTPFTLQAVWSKGKHQFTFGADYVTLPWSYVEDLLGGGTAGSFGFSHLETSLPGDFASQTGAGIASFYIGSVDSASVTSVINGHWDVSEAALYAQDKWRVNSKLTINYGLRWEITPPARESGDKMTTFDPSEPNPGASDYPGALSFYGVGPGRNGLTQIGNYYLRGFAPKLGVAYMVTPKTVFRSSFGISYYPYWDKWIWVIGAFVPQDGFSVTRATQSFNSGITPAFNWNQGFPLKFPNLPDLDPTLDNGQSAGYINPRENRPPLVENIGAEVERQLPGHVVVRVGYVGTMAHRIEVTYNLNQLPLQYLSLGNLLTQPANSTAAAAAGIRLPYAGFSGTVATALTPYPQYPGGVSDIEAQMGNSTYNSLQINVQRHFGDLTFLAAATFAKFLTIADNPGFGYGVASLKAQSYQIASTGKSLGGASPSSIGSAGDIPKQLNLSWYWNLPVGRGKHFLNHTSKPVDSLLGNWRFSAIQYYQAGQPIQITTNETIPSFGSVWANLNPGVPIKAVSNCGALHPGTSQGSYLNRAAFSDPAPFSLGNTFVLPTTRTCGYIDEDLGIEKAIPVGEKRRVAIGAMFVNLFNRHQFQGLNTDIDNSNFGTFSGANFPRTVQLYTKFYW